VNPMASFAPSSQIARAAEYWASYLPPRSPLVNSAETAGEMVEVYWMYVRVSTFIFRATSFSFDDVFVHNGMYRSLLSLRKVLES
jgi:hypothetical protein